MRDLSLIKQIPLFEGIEHNDLQGILKCLSAKNRCYKKGEYVMNAGDDIKNIGILTDGSLHVIKEDIFGSPIILTVLGVGDTFSEVLCCAGVTKSPVSVLAAANSEILFIDYTKLYAPCMNSCIFHSKLISNMLKILARKNMVLSEKINYLSMKSLRQKLCTFLSEYIIKTEKMQFVIPFDRNALADFLNTDRSALSRELGRMRDEGIIDFWKNEFKVINIEKLRECI